MSIEIILFGVIALVLVFDFALKGIKKKNVQDDVDRIGEEQSKKKPFNLNYLLKRKRNILTFILLVILFKPIINFQFFTESERKYDYQTKVDFQPYMKVYHKLDKSYPLNNDLNKKSISETINNTKYTFENDLYFSRGSLEDFVNNLQLLLRDRYDINQLDSSWFDERLDYLLDWLRIYKKNKKLYFESIDSLLVDQNLAEILFPKNLYSFLLNNNKHQHFYDVIGLGLGERYDFKSNSWKEIEVEYAFKIPKKLKVSSSRDLDEFIMAPWLSGSGTIIDWQRVSIVDIYKMIYRDIEVKIYQDMFHINNIFTEAGEKIITNNYNTIYSDWDLFEKKYGDTRGIPFKSSAKFYYHPFKYEIKSLSWHIEKVFKLKLWLFAVSFASLGVLVLLFNDKIKTR